MHYRSSLNPTPLNTLNELCNTPNPPNFLPSTATGTPVPGTNYTKNPGKVSAGTYVGPGTLEVCMDYCNNDVTCTGFSTITEFEKSPSGSCIISRASSRIDDDPERNFYAKINVPDTSTVVNPGMIKMTGADTSGQVSINGSTSMQGTAQQCIDVCTSSGDCGGFSRPSSLSDSAVGTCTWKNTSDILPRFDQSQPPNMTWDGVYALSTANLWRKQPKKTFISGFDSPLLIDNPTNLSGLI
jgi:hypothetical protein